MDQKEQRRMGLLIVLVSMSAGALLVANLAATKLWDFFGIAVDGGILIFPIEYILGDMMVEMYGEKSSKIATWAGVAFCGFSALVLMVVGRLPAYPGWTGQEAYAEILGFSAPRIILGSLVAYVVSQIANIVVFVKIREKTGDKWYFARSIGSSVVAHALDSGIFEVIAFLGVLPFNEFVHQAIFAYVAALLLEIAIFPVAKLLVMQAHKFLD